MDVPTPPADLTRSGAGRRFWTDTHRAYEIDARDRPVLRELCRSLDEIEQLRAVIAADGVMSVGASGQPVEHPAMGGLRAHRQTVDRLLYRLALPDEEGRRPPSARQRSAKTAANARWTVHRVAGGAG